MIAIFTPEAEAEAYSIKVHNYLTANRPRYNAIKWSEPIQSADGLEWWVKQPIEEDVDRWYVPLDSSVELANANITKQLPEFGVLVTIDEYYLYKGDIVKCRQTHNRTIYEPKDTPALFSFFRDNTDQLQWIPSEQVETGWMRIYDGVKYEVIQAHQTQIDWTPPNVPALWKVYIDTTLVNEWTIGVAYKVDDIVVYNGLEYKCRQAHTSIASWNPAAVLSLWLPI